MNRSRWRLATAAAILIVAAGAVPLRASDDWQTRFDRLIAASAAREAGARMAAVLKTRLDELPSASLERLAHDMVSNDRQIRLAAAWVLVRDFLDGDPANWSRLNGLLRPQNLPKSLLAVDGFYRLIIDLPGEGDGGVWLALREVQAFLRSSAGRLLFLEEAPAPVGAALAHITAVTGMNLPTPRSVGTLPLTQPVRGYVTQESAISLGWQLMDNFAVPATGSGGYAWDRVNGRVRRIVENDSFLFIPQP